jgi:TATA-box binding protein (TBP) (component of TFIID and TFIIIB)
MKFDTTKLLETLPINEELIKIEKSGIGKRGESKRDKIKRRSKKATTSNTTGFCHNSITLVMMNDGDKTQPLKEITIKIFQNGVFHMTGVLDESYDKCTIRNLLKIIWDTSKDSLKECPEMYEILNRRVVLMNYTTKLSSNDTVAREVLHNTIRALKSETIVSHYDPDVYPGVKINIGTGKWTAKIFRTGKIILTGIVEHSECLEFMKQLLCLFELVLPKKLKPLDMSDTSVPQLKLTKQKAT